MPRSRIVKPETTRLDLSEGDWILVKRRLNAGEERNKYALAYRWNGDGHRHVDMFETGIALVVTYLLDWSLVDEQGHVIPIRGTSDDTAAKQSALNALDYESFIEIKRAIEEHDNINGAQTTKKNEIPSGSPSSDPISPLPDDAAGGTSGSPS